MSGSNTTGKPRTTDYNLGRGRLYIGTLDPTTRKPTRGFRDVGNVTEFNLTVESEKLEHKSSRQGLAIVDKEITISQKVNGTFRADELSFENLKEFFAGDLASFDNSAALSSVTGSNNLTLWKEGRWYDLYASADGSGARLYDTGAVRIKAAGTGTNEQQTITIVADGGTFKITLGGQETAAIAWNATAAAVLAALEALSTVQPGDLTVALVGLVYTLTYKGQYAALNVAAVTTNVAALTNGLAAGTATVATSVAGVAGTEYTEGTDFEVDRVFGQVFIVADSTLGNLINESTGTAVDVLIAGNPSTDTSVDEVQGLKNSPSEVCVRFVSENPANDDHATEFVFHSVQLAADGDFSLIGDDWTQMGFQFVAGTNEDASPDSPTLTIRTHANA